MSGPVRHVRVVVPARDEEALLPDCLTALRHATEHLARTRTEVDVDVLVVLDGCTDASGLIAAEHGVSTLSCDLGRVGRVRALGAERALAAVPASEHERTYLLCTDADSSVPRHWLSAHLDLADDGADVIIGSVEPVGDADDGVLQAWRARHDLADGHPFVHGANLGVRASTYLDLGGFAPLAVHEDVDLVQRARAAGAHVLSSDRMRVASSARTDGRCPGGFAGYLRDLTREVS